MSDYTKFGIFLFMITIFFPILYPICLITDFIDNIKDRIKE